MFRHAVDLFYYSPSFMSESKMSKCMAKPYLIFISSHGIFENTAPHHVESSNIHTSWIIIRSKEAPKPKLTWCLVFKLLNVFFMRLKYK